MPKKERGGEKFECEKWARKMSLKYKITRSITLNLFSFFPHFPHFFYVTSISFLFLGDMRESYPCRHNKEGEKREIVEIEISKCFCSFH